MVTSMVDLPVQAALLADAAAWTSQVEHVLDAVSASAPTVAVAGQKQLLTALYESVALRLESRIHMLRRCAPSHSGSGAARGAAAQACACSHNRISPTQALAGSPGTRGRMQGQAGANPVQHQAPGSSAAAGSQVGEQQARRFRLLSALVRATVWQKEALVVLRREQVTGRDDWQWSQQLRHYWDKEWCTMHVSWLVVANPLATCDFGFGGGPVDLWDTCSLPLLL